MSTSFGELLSVFPKWISKGWRTGQVGWARSQRVSVRLLLSVARRHFPRDQWAIQWNCAFTDKRSCLRGKLTTQHPMVDILVISFGLMKHSNIALKTSAILLAGDSVIRGPDESEELLVCIPYALGSVSGM